MRNDGAPRRAMAATLTGCLMNILLDYVFIFPLGMGMFGAVLATGCSPILGLIIQSGHWLGGKASFHLQKTAPRPAELGFIGALGFPSFLSEACSGVVMILFNTILLQVEGSIGGGRLRRGGQSGAGGHRHVHRHRPGHPAAAQPGLRPA